MTRCLVRVLMIVVAILLVAARPASAQELDGTAWLDYDPDTGDVLASCTTYSSYYVGSYYGAKVYCELDNTDTWALLAQATATDDYGDAQVDFEVAADPGTNYEVFSDNFAVPAYQSSELVQCDVPCNYYDPFNFLSFTQGPVDAPSPRTWYGPGPQVIDAPKEENLGGDYQPMKTPTPHHLVIDNDTGTIDNSDCPPQKKRNIIYKIVDVNGNWIGAVNPFMKEQFSYISPNSCTGGTQPTILATCGIKPAAIFPDTLKLGCVAAQSTCGVNAYTQQWMWCKPGAAPVPLATVGDIQMYNDYVRVNGLLTARPPGTPVFP